MRNRWNSASRRIFQKIVRSGIRKNSDPACPNSYEFGYESLAMYL
jgi:hypothetical protein